MVRLRGIRLCGKNNKLVSSIKNYPVFFQNYAGQYKNMEFNEEKAREIVAKYGLSEKTIFVWKSRNRIPDKYMDEGYRPVPEASKADRIVLERIKGLKENGYINFAVLSELAGVDTQCLYDAVRGKSRIGKEDIGRTVLELKKLKAFINNNLQNRPAALKRLMDNKLIKYYSVNGKDEWAKSMYYAISKGNQLSQTDFMRLKDNYLRIYIMLNI